MIKVSEQTHPEGGFEQWFRYEGKSARVWTPLKWEEMTDSERTFYEDQLTEWFRVACHTDKGRMKGD